MAWIKSTAKCIFAAIKRWMDDDGFLMASALAYYLALSLVPLLLVLISTLGIVLRTTGWGRSAQQQVMETLSQQASPEVASEVATVLDQVQADSALNSPISAALLLLASLAVFAQLDRSFDRIWKKQDAPRRGPWKSALNVIFGRLHAFVMLLAVVALVIITLLSGVAVEAIQRYTTLALPAFKWLWNWAPVGITLFVNMLLFTLLYHVIPQTAVRWRDALHGGILVAVSWEIGRQLMMAFVIGDKYTAYGVVGSFLAVMLWGYFAAALILLGAEYVKVVSEASADAADSN